MASRTTKSLSRSIWSSPSSTPRGGCGFEGRDGIELLAKLGAGTHQRKSGKGGTIMYVFSRIGRGRRRNRTLRSRLCCVGLALILASIPCLGAAEPGPDQDREARIDRLLKFLDGLSIGTLSYFEYSGGKHDDGESFNEFRVTRSYIDVKMRLAPWLRFRITPDAHQLETGDFEVRLKYLYAELRPPDLGFVTDMKSEVGISHMPWLDFEEHINPYRVQGTMFIERAGTFNSADLGLSIGGYLGGQLDGEFQHDVSHYYPGRWGSWHVGVYNGGGYHAEEHNKNKVPEYRLSLRPLPDVVPGLQVHYFGLIGKGNTEEVGSFPDYRVNLVMLSYQNAWITFTGQYARTRGNAKGSLVDPATGAALRAQGYSFFVDGKLPVLDRTLSLFARYDRFDPDREDWLSSGDDEYNLVNAGVAWRFFRQWMLLLAYERIMYGENNGGLGDVPVPGNDLATDWRVQTALQMKF
jgi:hypothetical protein